MTYLHRKADDFLISWKHDAARMPLLIKGARQVGKTSTILWFARSNYENVIVINFVEEPKYHSITSDGYRAEDIIRNISVIDPAKKFIPGKTLIFFDELQAFPDIATSLKFFREDGRFDVICSGSLLGINYRQIESNSVGSKTDYLMHSLDFEEFLWAKGYNENTITDMLNHILEQKPFNDAEMQTYSSLCSPCGLKMEGCGHPNLPEI